MRYIRRDYDFDLPTETRKFDIKGKPSGKWIPLEEFGQDFVEYIYGASFDKLPEIFRGRTVLHDAMDISMEFDKQANIWLPEEGCICPVTRGAKNNPFSLRADRAQTHWYSRGYKY